MRVKGSFANNVDPPSDLPVAQDGPADDAGPLPSEDELDSLVAQVDVNDVDQRGFDVDDAASGGGLDG